ncbi:MAG: hypothetical protein K9H11_09185, partial [Rhodospirillum sp.]|nr:hypothetical protein [Rhodospirillum sp.]
MTEDIEGFRLSPQQRRLFALGQENDRITATLRVRGNVDETVLQSALHHLRERHESLRTDYVSPEIGSLPLQVIRRTEDPVTAVDFSPRQSTDGWLIQISAAALSLDSASLGVILSDLAAFCDGAPPRTDPLQYADASQWFRDQVQDRELASRYFWDERTPPRPSEKPSGKGLVRATVLAKGRARAFRAISGRIGGGEKAVALLCWTRVLASVELNGTDLVDVCFDARPFPELRELVGPTEIIAPLRTTYDADAHAAEIAQRLDAEMADAEEHLFALPVDFPLAPAGFRWQPEFPAEQQGDTAFFYENLC